MSLTSFIYSLLRTSNDLKAIRKGRVKKRLADKVIGRVAGGLMRR